MLEERKDHGTAVERRPDAIHLYGVDRMSTQECLAYFAEYGPRRVEWLDDSSCNVVFGDVNSAKRAVLGKGRPFSPGDAPDLQGICPISLQFGLSYETTPDCNNLGVGLVRIAWSPLPLYRVCPRLRVVLSGVGGGGVGVGPPFLCLYG